MTTIMLYAAAGICLGISLFRSRQRSIRALKKAWKALENILPQILAILLLVGIVVEALNPETISRIIGSESGWFGTLLASAVGSVTLIPGFIAFPMADLLLSRGAGYMQIAAFVSSLMMVGVLTFPVERRFLGTKAAILRNGMAFLFAFPVAAAISWVVAL